MLTDKGGLEMKLEKLVEERDRMGKEQEAAKNERDRKMEDMRKQFDREKELLKTKVQDAQSKSKNLEQK